MKTIRTPIFLLAVALGAWSAWGQTTNEIEQIADIHVHTALGTANTGASAKLGAGFDGGDGAVLMKWDETDPGLASVSSAILEIKNLHTLSDGSFTVHQMITDWDTNTDFGTTFPEPGVDYVAAPVSVGGLNNGPTPPNSALLVGGPKEDTFSIGHLVKAWVDTPALNKGLILVPRPQLNGAYPFAHQPEIQVTSSRRVPGGLDSDDCRIHAISGATGTFSSVRLEAVEDASVSPAGGGDGYARQNVVVPTGLDGPDPKIALLKFGLGELVVSNPTAGIVITNALLELHCDLPSSPVAIDINLHGMLVNWDEATVTWNQFGGSGPQPDVHYDATILGTVTLGGGTNGGVESASLDITEIANGWFQDPGSNFGVACIADGAATSQVTLLSSEFDLGFVGTNDTVLIVGTAPVIEEPPVTTNQVAGVAAVTFDTAPGTEYVLQESTNMIADAWADADGSVIGDGADKSLYDADTADANKGYRVRVRD